MQFNFDTHYLQQFWNQYSDELSQLLNHMDSIEKTQRERTPSEIKDIHSYLYSLTYPDSSILNFNNSSFDSHSHSEHTTIEQFNKFQSSGKYCFIFLSYLSSSEFIYFLKYMNEHQHTSFITIFNDAYNNLNENTDIMEYAFLFLFRLKVLLEKDLLQYIVSNLPQSIIYSLSHTLLNLNQKNYHLRYLNDIQEVVKTPLLFELNPDSKFYINNLMLSTTLNRLHTSYREHPILNKKFNIFSQYESLYKINDSDHKDNLNNITHASNHLIDQYPTTVISKDSIELLNNVLTQYLSKKPVVERIEKNLCAEIFKNIEDPVNGKSQYHYFNQSEQNNKFANLLAASEPIVKNKTKQQIRWISEESILKLKEDVVDNSHNPSDRERLSRIIKYLNILNPHKDSLYINEFSKFNSLLEEHPNFAEPLKFFKGNFILNQSKEKYKYQAPTPILLLGDPGIGKTYFAKQLAKLLDTSCYFIDANSISASWVLAGSSSQWKGADAGNIFKYILNANTASPLVVFDEIDKLSYGKNHDPFSTFHQLLEPTNSQKFHDEFLDIDFDASHFIYILTANDIHNIPESLLSRMQVFHIQPPNKKETRAIANNIYKTLLDGSPLFTHTLNNEQLSCLENMTPRDISKLLKANLFNQAVDIDSEQLIEPQLLKISNNHNNSDKFGF